MLQTDTLQTDMTQKNTVNSEDHLRKIIPHYPPVMDKRIKPQLDDYSLEYIHLSRQLVLGFSDSALGMHYLDLNSCQFNITSMNRLSFSLTDLKLPNNLNNIHCSLYFIIPGVGHGLRVNGHTIKTNATNREKEENTNSEEDLNNRALIHIYIDEVYVHCSRSAVRSGLWNEASIVSASLIQQFNNMSGSDKNINESSNRFIESAPFLFLKTQDSKGKTDISPRGDPDKIVNILENNTVLIAERSGNKVAKSMRNIMQSHTAALSLLIPGCNNTLTLYGKAQVTSNKALLEPLTINKKTPKLGILINIQHFEFSNSESLTSSELWNAKHHKSAGDLTTFSKVLTHHMKGTGIMGKISTPIIKAIVHHDLNNLY